MLANEFEVVQGDLRDLLLRIPNLPHPEAPDGAGDVDNPVVKGPINLSTEFPEHRRVPHWETATALGILDNERATKISGAMFTMQRGNGAALARALCQYALDRNVDEFEEIRPPSLVTTATLTSTGQLPKFADDAYNIERDDLWCIPTAEVPLTSIYAGEVIDAEQLPLKMMAYTPCYRREAGSAGRDTRGMLRAHEFDKVEILAVARPEQAPRPAGRDDRSRRGVDRSGSAFRTGSSRSAPATWARAITAASTSRSTRRAATPGSRSRRSRGSATTSPGAPTSASRRRPEGHSDDPHAERFGAWPFRACGRRSSRTIASPTAA